MDCRKVNARLADLLLDEDSAPADVRHHAESCESCRHALSELRITMQAMEEWEAPELSPFFGARFAARLRAEKEAAPAGLLERIRARLLFGSRVRLQPLLAGALALVVLAGGGTYADLALRQTHTQESATVRDLQSLDGNAQIFQQLDSVDQQDQDTNAAGDPQAND